jgi:LDH2 family malate/lactate/ureidoglycolate dehydrogenase
VRVEARFRAEDLQQYGVQVLVALGVPEEDAAAVTSCLLMADLQGITSHGLVRLPVYARRLEAGVVKSRPSMTFEGEGQAVGLLDGDNGLGPVVGCTAMRKAIATAERCGLGLVFVKRSNHYGAAAYYVKMATDAGLIGATVSNAPPNMAAFGGKTRFLGTNPLGVGLPTRDVPIIFDMATSVVARGKIIVAAQQKQPIPLGWAVDPDGHPTTDAQQALLGAVLPFGGAKGSAISLLIDIFSGVLTGAGYATGLGTLEDLAGEQNLGHVFMTLKPDLFQSRETYNDRIDDIIRQLRDNPPAPGFDSVLAPGDIEYRHATAALQEGVALPAEIVASLRELAERHHCDFPAPVTAQTSPVSAKEETHAG